ncbi:MAG TPA: hypothetical protein VFU24_14105 [Burkholderiales bacterium]|nr:hypothetical protein [Burkholderiales bacterium]
MQLTFGFGAHGMVVGMTASVVETTYYTTHIATERGAVRFKDERTGNAVTLQSPELKKISKQEFMQGAALPAPVATVGAQWPSAPAAAGGSAAPARPQ